MENKRLIKALENIYQINIVNKSNFKINEEYTLNNLNEKLKKTLFIKETMFNEKINDEINNYRKKILKDIFSIIPLIGMGFTKYCGTNKWFNANINAKDFYSEKKESKLETIKKWTENEAKKINKTFFISFLKASDNDISFSENEVKIRTFYKEIVEEIFNWRNYLKTKNKKNEDLSVVNILAIILFLPDTINSFYFNKIKFYFIQIFKLKNNENNSVKEELFNEFKFLKQKVNNYKKISNKIRSDKSKNILTPDNLFYTNNVDSELELLFKKLNITTNIDLFKNTEEYKQIWISRMIKINYLFTSFLHNFENLTLFKDKIDSKKSGNATIKKVVDQETFQLNKENLNSIEENLKEIGNNFSLLRHNYFIFDSNKSYRDFSSFDQLIKDFSDKFLKLYKTIQTITDGNWIKLISENEEDWKEHIFLGTKFNTRNFEKYLEERKPKESFLYKSAFLSLLNREIKNFKKNINDIWDIDIYFKWNEQTTKNQKFFLKKKKASSTYFDKKNLLENIEKYLNRNKNIITNNSKIKIKQIIESIKKQININKNTLAKIEINVYYNNYLKINKNYQKNIHYTEVNVLAFKNFHSSFNKTPITYRGKIDSFFEDLNKEYSPLDSKTFVNFSEAKKQEYYKKIEAKINNSYKSFNANISLKCFSDLIKKEYLEKIYFLIVKYLIEKNEENYEKMIKKIWEIFKNNKALKEKNINVNYYYFFEMPFVIKEIFIPHNKSLKKILTDNKKIFKNINEYDNFLKRSNNINTQSSDNWLKLSYDVLRAIESFYKPEMYFKEKKDYYLEEKDEKRSEILFNDTMDKTLTDKQLSNIIKDIKIYFKKWNLKKEYINKIDKKDFKDHNDIFKLKEELNETFKNMKKPNISFNLKNDYISIDVEKKVDKTYHLCRVNVKKDINDEIIKIINHENTLKKWEKIDNETLKESLFDFKESQDFSKIFHYENKDDIETLKKLIIE